MRRPTFYLMRPIYRTLITFRNKLLRKIDGFILESGTWRIGSNKELGELFKEQDLVEIIN